MALTGRQSAAVVGRQERKIGRVNDLRFGPPNARDALRDVPVTKDVASDQKKEAGALLKALAASQLQAELAMGNDYWVTIVFPSGVEAEAFRHATGWGAFADKSGLYLDGVAIAEELGIKLPPAHWKAMEPRRDARLIEEVGTHDKSGKDFKKGTKKA